VVSGGRLRAQREVVMKTRTPEEDLRMLEGDIASDTDLSMKDRYELRLACAVVRSLHGVSTALHNLHYSIQSIEMNTRN